MPNIIRIKNFDNETNLNGDIILPVDHTIYGSVAKQIKISQLKEYVLSGITDSSSSGTSGTSGIDGIIGLDGQDGTSGLLSYSGLTHNLKILNYCSECNSGITGTFRHKIVQNFSYLEMCMQVSATNYSWISVYPNAITTTTTTTSAPTT